MIYFIGGAITMFIVWRYLAKWLVKRYVKKGQVLIITLSKDKQTFKVHGNADQIIEAYRRAKEYRPHSVKYVDTK